jgi:putative phosphoribosyl transferase
MGLSTMARVRFQNRTEAGRQLAGSLAHYQGQPNVIVLALPRGGVPVAAEVAAALGAPLDLLLVRKLGLPGHEELAMGAIASGGAMVLNESLLDQLPIDQGTIDSVADRERRELTRRDHAYRGERQPPAVEGKTVIVVDDGLATGATMRAGVAALRQLQPDRVVVAVPVAPPDTVSLLEQETDEVVALSTPEPFYGVGYWYEDFTQTSDDEVRGHLAQAWQAPARPGAVPPPQ